MAYEMTAHEQKIWAQISQEMRQLLGENQYLMWMTPLTAHFEGKTLNLVAANAFVADHVRQHHSALIEEKLLKYGQGGFTQVRIDVPKKMPLKQKSKAPVIEHGHTFDTFVVGKCNQFAFKSCVELSRRQKQEVNFLFIYGSSGLGKTHLIQAAANKFAKAGGKFSYFSSESFVTQVVEALRQNRMESFKRSVQSSELLIVDDVHVLAGKPKTAIELLTLFESFLDDKRIILAADRHPAHLAEFDERAKSRFSSGLSLAIEMPALDTRVQILQAKANARGIILPKECALFIAQNITSDVRRLEGALNKALAMANLLGEGITLDLLRHALKDVLVVQAQHLSIDGIKSMVAKFYDIHPKELDSKKRTRQIARPRQIAMSLCRQLTDASYPDIGAAFGGRDHTTVMYACEQVARLRQEDVLFEDNYQNFLLMLSQH